MNYAKSLLGQLIPHDIFNWDIVTIELKKKKKKTIELYILKAISALNEFCTSLFLYLEISLVAIQ